MFAPAFMRFNYGCGVPGCGFRFRPGDVPQRHVGAKESKGWDRILKMSEKPRRDFCPTSPGDPCM